MAIDNYIDDIKIRLEFFLQKKRYPFDNYSTRSLVKKLMMTQAG